MLIFWVESINKRKKEEGWGGEIADINILSEGVLITNDLDFLVEQLLKHYLDIVRDPYQ